MLPGYFYPEQAASSYLSDNRYDAFAKAGFDMLVYTPMPTRGVDKTVIDEYKKKKTELLYGGKMEVHRFPMFSEGKSTVLRALRYLSCSAIQFYKGIKAKDIDCIYI